MSARNQLLAAPPFEVERTLKTLGASLRTARLRRGLSQEVVAEKIGTSRFVIADAEDGKPSTGIAVYAALLWAYGLSQQLAEVAAPDLDKEGMALELGRTRKRARSSGMSNDF